MYAFIEIGGKQIKVKEGSRFSVFRIKDKKVGDEIELKPICFLDGNEIITEREKLNNISVICEVIEEKKGKKIYVFRKTAKTGYRRGIGHRDRLTILKVKSIVKK
ncbi:MAG: 50S ribosomal protein L21 [Candidatus Omnitrophica bacterium]|nr:50S ribosomal protein L21 [Candidatus Omnitrophota bacterium]